MCPKKHVLSINESAQSVTFGVTSTLDEFQFLNLLQQEVGVELQVSEQISIVNSVGKEHTFAIYSYVDNERMISYDFIVNKSINGVILEFLDNINYLMRCSADYIELEEGRIYSLLNNLQSVLFVQKLNKAMFTTKQNALLKSIFPYV